MQQLDALDACQLPVHVLCVVVIAVANCRCTTAPWVPILPIWVSVCPRFCVDVYIHCVCVCNFHAHTPSQGTPEGAVMVAVAMPLETIKDQQLRGNNQRGTINGQRSSIN